MRLIHLLERRLDELQDIGDPSQMTGRELKDQLEDAGWAKVGEDTSYSDVYGKSGAPWVIKLLKVSRSGAVSVDFQCAMQWYRYCLQNWQSNPHLPRIPFVKTLRADSTIGADGYRKDNVTDHRTYVVMIELLEEFDPATYEWRREDPIDNAIMWTVMASVVGIYDHRWYKEDDQLRAFTTLLRLLPKTKISGLVSQYHEGFYGEFGGSMNEPWSDGWFDSLTKAMLASGGYMEISDMMERGLEVAAKQGNNMAIAMLQIHKAGQDNGCQIDLHTGNVMVRSSTGDLVITDPVQG